MQLLGRWQLGAGRGLTRINMDRPVAPKAKQLSGRILKKPPQRMAAVSSGPGYLACVRGIKLPTPPAQYPEKARQGHSAASARAIPITRITSPPGTTVSLCRDGTSAQSRHRELA